jgi:Tol biopolymer transport system component
VTPIPLAPAPIIPEVAGQETEPYHLIVRESSGTRPWNTTEEAHPINSVLRLVSSDGSDGGILIDTEAAAGLYLGHSASHIGPAPLWGAPSPSGKQLALGGIDRWDKQDVQERGPGTSSIYLFDLETESFGFLAEGRDPAWSPDGRQIAYYQEGLWVIDLATREKRPLFQTPLGQQQYPAPLWSPDGESIALLNYPDGLNGKPEVIVVNSTDAPDPTQLVEQSGSIEWLRWFPEGQALVYGSMECVSTGRDYVTRSWFVDLAGNKSEWFGYSHLLIPGMALQWSPGGRWLLFPAIPVYENIEGQQGDFYDLWLVGVDGRDLHRLTLDQANESDAQWSPDGTEVVFGKQEQGIWALNLVTGQTRQLWPDGETGFLVVR